MSKPIPPKGFIWVTAVRGGQAVLVQIKRISFVNPVNSHPENPPNLKAEILVDNYCLQTAETAEEISLLILAAQDG